MKKNYVRYKSENIAKGCYILVKNEEPSMQNQKHLFYETQNFTFNDKQKRVML